MVQAADRRQDGATSTPPSLPAPSWRRDFSGNQVVRIPPGTFQADPPGIVPEPREHDRPAAVMVAAPMLGAMMWGAILYLIFA